MRLSEYTQAMKGWKSHNLHWDAITLNDLGFGVSFWTDKASRKDPAAKHRHIAWSFLPDFAESVFRAYIKTTPKGVQYFFVHEDGTQVTRSQFENDLDLCNLHMRWAKLLAKPHGFRMEGASHAHIQGENILNIRYMGRWSPTSIAIKPYTRVPFALKKPEELYDKLPRYRCQWSPKRISYLARLAVQTPGGKNHTFLQDIRKNFPDFETNYPGTLLDNFPTSIMKFKLREMRHHKIQGHTLKQQ